MVMNKIFLKLLLCGAACSAVFGGEARFAEFFRFFEIPGFFRAEHG